jgi:hypothetical protein
MKNNKFLNDLVNDLRNKTDEELIDELKKNHIEYTDMRNLTYEEECSYSKGLKEISTPTGVSLFDE